MSKLTLRLCVFSVSFIAVAPLFADPTPSVNLADMTPPGKPHFDSKGAKVGEQLPNFPMHGLDGKTLSLAEGWAQGPTLLLTSSYSCPRSRATYPQAAELAQKMAGRGVRVAMVYIIEAHPAGDASPYSGKEEVTEENRRDQILCRQPRTLAERVKLANEFAARFTIKIPVFVDSMDNAAWSTLGGGPNMGVLVNQNGIVLARQGWFDAKSMEAALQVFVKATPISAVPAKPDEAALEIEHTIRDMVVSGEAVKLTALFARQPKLRNVRLSEYAGEYLLQTAAIYGQLEVVKLLVAGGADVNCETEECSRPLHRAAEGGHADVTQFLIEHGADVNAKEHGHGPTALQLALLSKGQKTASLLIKAGAKPNFYTAAATGDLAELQRELLHDPTLLHRPDGRGRSALLYAVAAEQMEAANLLMSLGAHDFASRSSDERATWWALQRKNLELFNRLLDAGSDPNLFGSVIYEESPIELTRALLAHQADSNKTNSSGVAALHLAAGYGRIDIMQLLLASGADIHVRVTQDNGLMCGPSYYKGDTPLLVAAENKHPAAMKFLLEHGANVNACNNDGETAMHRVLWNDPKVAEQMARLLIAHHANINATDRSGRTPLDCTPPSDIGVFSPSEESLAPIIQLMKKAGAVNGKAKQ